MANPPITTIARLCDTKLPVSACFTNSGSIAQIVAIAVMKIGLILVAVASTSASRIIIFCSFCFTRSKSTIAFVTTIPISINAPRSAVISTGIPLIRIPKMAPIAASGREQRIAIGALIDLNVMTIIKNTIPMETSIMRNKSVKSSACWLLDPPTRTSTFSGRSMPFLSFYRRKFLDLLRSKFPIALLDQLKLLLGGRHPHLYGTG